MTDKSQLDLEEIKYGGSFTPESYNSAIVTCEEEIDDKNEQQKLILKYFKKLHDMKIKLPNDIIITCLRSGLDLVLKWVIKNNARKCKLNHLNIIMTDTPKNIQTMMKQVYNYGCKFDFDDDQKKLDFRMFSIIISSQLFSCSYDLRLQIIQEYIKANIPSYNWFVRSENGNEYYLDVTDDPKQRRFIKNLLKMFIDHQIPINQEHAKMLNDIWPKSHLKLLNQLSLINNFIEKEEYQEDEDGWWNNSEPSVPYKQTKDTSPRSKAKKKTKL